MHLQYNCKYSCVYIVITLIFCSSLYRVDACGGVTHNIIGKRATYFLEANPELAEYAEIIKTNQDAFQNGASFPDWGYDCFLIEAGFDQLPNASEAAHWPPFQNATMDYIRRNYQKPWNQEAQKLIAFLLGIVSHSTADISWHNLGYVQSRIHQGFTEAMAHIMYNHSFSASHTEADIGGEFMAAYEVDLSFLSPSWYLPAQAMSDIYIEMGFYQAIPWVLQACNKELLGLVMTIQKVPPSMLFEHFASSSVFLVDQYQDWWIGGVNDMAVWTSQCWPNIVDSIENGPRKDNICLMESKWYWNDSSTFDVVSRTHKESKIRARAALRQTLIDMEMKPPEIDMTDALGGSVFEGARILSKVEEVARSTSCLPAGAATEDQIVIGTNQSFALFGSSISIEDLNHDGLDDVLIGAPGDDVQTGAVYVIYGTNSLGQTLHLAEDMSSITFFGEKINNRFGYATEIVDFNLDGFKDIVVSAPGYGSELLTYTGKVYIFFGSPTGFDSANNMTITTRRRYSNLGMSLRVGDVNGDDKPDLIIGSPFASSFRLNETGYVFAFASSESHSRRHELTTRDALWAYKGSHEYEWFGYHMEFVKIGEQMLLIVGAPLFQETENWNLPVGKLYCFDVTHIASTTRPLWTIIGSADDKSGQLGYSFTVGKPLGSVPLLALSLPTKDYPSLTWWGSGVEQGGQVVVLTMANLLDTYYIDELVPVVQFNSDQSFERLGQTLEFFDIDRDGNDELLIGSPYRDNSPQFEHGAIYVWKGGSSSFPIGQVDNPMDGSTLCFVGSNQRSLYGKAVKRLDFNGDGNMDIIMGGPRDPQYAENGGTVSIVLSVPGF